jgi:hypothetical protein
MNAASALGSLPRPPERSPSLLNGLIELLSWRALDHLAFCVSRICTHRTPKWLTQTDSSDLISHAASTDIGQSLPNPRFVSITLIRSLGHLALWPTLYTIGVLVLTDWFYARSIPPWTAICFVSLCAHGCYLLDRIKISDARLDPADKLAQPHRYAFVSRHAKLLRLIALTDLILAMGAAMLLTMWLIWIPAVAMGCVHLYAGRVPDAAHPRLKDYPVIKAFFIAGGHMALALAASIVSHGLDLQHYALALWITLLGVGAIVFSDAVLCDLDDLYTDQQYGTKSIPVLFGEHSAWQIVIVSHAAGCALLGVMLGWSVAIGLLAAGLLVSDTLLRLMQRQRDFVDARLLPLAVLVVLVSR